MKKLLLTTAMFMALNIASETEQTCMHIAQLDGSYDVKEIAKTINGCDNDDLLQVYYLKAHHMANLIADYCRYDRNIDKTFTEVGWTFSCVLFKNRY